MEFWKIKPYPQIGVILVMILLFISCAPIDPEADNGSPPDGGMDFPAGAAVFDLQPGESTARFIIDEILRGEEKKVVGETNQIRGQIGLDFSDPAAAAVSPIQVDARTLLTDNGFRNRAVQRSILLTGIYPFVTFTPTRVSGLPDTITPGQQVDFQIAGDLTITNISKPIFFRVTAVPVSAARLEGQASAAIQREDFNLQIPAATGVAAVGEEVTLEIDFTATSSE